MPDIKTNIKLKPCPFCGSQPVLCHWHEKWRGDQYEVECRNVECPVFDCHDEADEAAEAWNTRVTNDT